MKKYRKSSIDLNDIVGKKFGRLTVIKYDHTEYHKAINSKYYSYYTIHYYLCQCECEKKTLKLIERSSLLKGRTRSCGCIHAELCRINNAKLKKDYNAFGRKFYTTWKCMKRRLFSLTKPERKWII